jgi:hypothetical protein
MSLPGMDVDVGDERGADDIIMSLKCTFRCDGIIITGPAGP